MAERSSDPKGSSGARSTHVHDAGFVLHSYPYRETSLIVETWTRHHGRVALMAKGAKRPKSALRGQLLAFQPLRLSWVGKSELRTLTTVEWPAVAPQLAGTALLCAFYMNELLLKLTRRDDPHEQLFDEYAATLAQLRNPEPRPADLLRNYELRLLAELGYGLTLTHEADSATPLDPRATYDYVIDRGPVRAEANANQPQFHGETLLALAAGDYTAEKTRAAAKWLLRTAIDFHLGDQALLTRQLIRDLKAFE